MAMRVVMEVSRIRHTWRGPRRQAGLTLGKTSVSLRQQTEETPMLKVVTGVLAGLVGLSAGAAAQNYPSRPITLVIPFAAGGPTDVLGRVIGAKMGEILGQQLVIENVTGAGGQTGSKRVADSAPDGYNLVIGTVGTHAQAQTLYKKPLYNSQTDFTPVGLIAQVPIALIARKDLPAQDFKEFVTYAKENQSKMQFGSAGAGSATHLGCVLLNYMIGVNVTHVPYRGTGPAMQDLIAGRLDYICEIVTIIKSQLEAGTIKGLALLDSKRSPALPNLPTAEEQGTKGLIAYTWNAIFLPKGAPEAVVSKLNDAMLKAMHAPEVKEKLSSLGVEIVPDKQASPAALAKLVKDETEKWAAPIKASGVTVE
jgi:tripartite-type tricarboxylate transporter receptor subunit TctC